MKNIITIDIDTERDVPISINKPPELFPKKGEYDNMLRQDIKDLVNTSIYLASMLDESDERLIMSEIKEMITQRYDAIKWDKKNP